MHKALDREPSRISDGSGSRTTEMYSVMVNEYAKDGRQ
jgi:hypothetical protein